ncbi:MAG: hypothetical protein AAB066_02030, partial [Candidatus Margulisiibacteriota bacterium]
AIILCPPFCDASITELCDLLLSSNGWIAPVVILATDASISPGFPVVVKDPAHLGEALDQVLQHGSRVQNRIRSDIALAHHFFSAYTKKAINDSRKIGAALNGVITDSPFGDPATFYLASKMALSWPDIVSQYQSETLDTLPQREVLRYWIVGANKDMCTRLAQAMPANTLERTVEAISDSQFGMASVDGLIFCGDRSMPDLTGPWARDLDIVVLTDTPETHVQADYTLPIHTESIVFWAVIHRLAEQRRWRVVVPKLTVRLDRQKVSFEVRLQMLDCLCRALQEREQMLPLRQVYALFPEAVRNGQPASLEVKPMTIQTGLEIWLHGLCGLLSGQ